MSKVKTLSGAFIVIAVLCAIVMFGSLYWWLFKGGSNGLLLTVLSMSLTTLAMLTMLKSQKSE